MLSNTVVFAIKYSVGEDAVGVGVAVDVSQCGCIGDAAAVVVVAEVARRRITNATMCDSIVLISVHGAICDLDERRVGYGLGGLVTISNILEAGSGTK